MTAPLWEEAPLCRNHDRNAFDCGEEGLDAYLKDAGRARAFFEAIERRFVRQARATTVLAGLTGFFMTARLDLWSRFHSDAYWWMHAMIAVRLLFTIMLFVAEPLALHRWFHERAMSDPEGTFVQIERMHRILLVVSSITIFGAVAGSHGWLPS